MSAPAIEFRDAGFSYAALDGEADGAPRGAAGASDGGSGAHARGAASVSGVNLVVRPGECVVLTGPSGCGKTTLTRMVNGLIPALYAGEATGEVLVQGVPMDAWEMDDLSCAVGSVFQNPRSQFFNLDTTSEVAFGCENMGVPQGEMHARVAATVRELSIERLMERDIRALSGGEKQLVAVASVHAMEPSVFVLDEPTAALDVDAMKRLRDVLARLKAAGKAILVAEHRLWWLAGVADRIVLMEDGRITCDLPVAEFAAMPAAERARKGLRAWDIAEVEPAAKDSEDRGGVEARTLEASCAEEPAHPLLEVRGLEARERRDGEALPEEEAAALVDRTLADFALGDFRERHPLSLSGGQRQRLAIAAGALQGARVMVLDEPTSGLDLANMRRVAAQIERLKARGTCLVIVTHDFEFACATCDELAFMADGRIAERFAFSSRTLRRAREVFGFG